jgi:hypothetical protein
MHKRVTATLAAIATTVAGLLVTASPASAKDYGDPGSCNWRLDGLRAHYSIGQTHMHVYADGDCTYADEWDVTIGIRNAANQRLTAIDLYGCGGDFYNTIDPEDGDCINPDNFDTYESETDAPLTINKPGTYHTNNGGAYAYDFYDDSFYDDSLDTQRFTAKYATITALKLTRTGNRISYTIHPFHYDTSKRTYLTSWTGKTYLQRWDGFRWISIKTYTGPVTTHITAAKHYKYRAYSPETGQRWASGSAGHTA